MNRNEMIKWLSENTTREQWVTGFKLPKFKTTLKDIPWRVLRSKVSNDPYHYVTHLFPNVNSPVIRIDDVFEPVKEQPVTREEMIKWLSENTTREQWCDSIKLEEIIDNDNWNTYDRVNNGGVIVLNRSKNIRHGITIDDVFEPVSEQPVYIDGGIYEIGVMNGEPQQFVYNLKLNMFERGTNQSISASSVHNSRIVTHFKLISEPKSITDRDIIDSIKREEGYEFTRGYGGSIPDSCKPMNECPHQTSLSQPRLSDNFKILIGDEPLTGYYRSFEPLGKSEDVNKSSAVSILNDAAECIGDRAAERDTDNERSMLSTVNAFNAMYGTELTETQGWMFLAFLKASRAKGGDFREDDYTDGAAYFALAGECDGNVRR